MKHSLLLVCLFSGFLTKAAIPEKTIQATITNIQATQPPSKPEYDKLPTFGNHKMAPTPNSKNFA